MVARCPINMLTSVLLVVVVTVRVTAVDEPPTGTATQHVTSNEQPDGENE